jgi:hypothetical protein
MLISALQIKILGVGSQGAAAKYGKKHYTRDNKFPEQAFKRFKQLY